MNLLMKVIMKCKVSLPLPKDFSSLQIKCCPVSLLTQLLLSAILLVKLVHTPLVSDDVMCHNNIHNREEGVNTSIMFFLSLLLVCQIEPVQADRQVTVHRLDCVDHSHETCCRHPGKSPHPTESVFRNVSGSCLRFIEERASFDFGWLSLSALWRYSHALGSFVYSNWINLWLRKRSTYNLPMTDWRKSRVSRAELCGMRHDVIKEGGICDCLLWLTLYMHFPLLIYMELVWLPPNICVSTVKNSEPHYAAYLHCIHLKHWNAAF